MQELYERWLSCGEDWTKSSWLLSLTSTSSHHKKGARRWMTRSQIAEKYNGSWDIADEIIAAKNTPEHADQRKPHPDLPNRRDPGIQ